MIVLLGGPGAGKGTQARLLAPRLGIPHVSSGELLRQRGGAAEKHLSAGELLPDDVVTDAVLQRLAQPDAARGAILDGFPRTTRQAEALDDWLAQRGGSVSSTVFLDVPRRTMIERVEERGQVSQRSDDRSDVADRRADVFNDWLPGLLEHYTRRGPVVTIDGSQPVDEVQRQIIASLDHRQPPAHS
ncbi:MAG TPA: nucleoside monophosphate kinase [Chloroflexota bacterium]|nr:nucleoside monophosphate kinase [Chloroflexota bacterium]